MHERERSIKTIRDGMCRVTKRLIDDVEKCCRLGMGSGASTIHKKQWGEKKRMNIGFIDLEKPLAKLTKCRR